MTVEQIVAGAIGGSPAALILFYWVVTANRERRELLEKLLDLSAQTANVNVATKDALKGINDGINQILGSLK